MELSTLLESKLKENNTSEIILMSKYGEKTRIGKNDIIKDENDFIYIFKEDGTIEILLSIKDISKIIIKRYESITRDNISVY